MNERLDRLEQTVAELAREVSALRAELDRRAAEPWQTGPRASGVPRDPLPTDSGPPPPPRLAPAAAAARPAHAERAAGPGRRGVDLEALVGRYGTLALASLTILMGVGAFLGWAIAQGKIGPGARVTLGGIAALAVAVAGWRLRMRGSRRFGNTLLALALALVHVDAWGAGPYLGLVPDGIALGVAALASIALAGLAWRGKEESLFSVGVGGALLAPYVTSSQSGNPAALVAYGALVLGCGMAATRGRPWRAAAAVMTIGCWLYTATAVRAMPDTAGPIERDGPVLFALAVAWGAIVVMGGEWGARVARSALVAMLGAIIAQAFDRAPAADLLVLAGAGTATAYAIAREHAGPRRHGIFTTAILPLAFGAAAVTTVAETALARAAVALAWSAGAVGAVRIAPSVRATHYMVAGIASGAAIVLAFERYPIATSIALAGHAALLGLLLRRLRTSLIAVPIALGLAIATSSTFGLLNTRPLYGYRPFATAESLAALAVCAAWLVVSWHVSRAAFDDARDWGPEARTAVRLAGAIVTFLWGRTELARAISADVATFLLIFYYASVGVAAIFVGRRRRVPLLRHGGLALAIFAALKAVAQASSLGIGLRVGSYFLAGVFLLAVAYWYRARDEDLAASPEPAPGHPG